MQLGNCPIYHLSPSFIIEPAAFKRAELQRVLSGSLANCPVGQIFGSKFFQLYYLGGYAIILLTFRTSNFGFFHLIVRCVLN